MKFKKFIMTFLISIFTLVTICFAVDACVDCGGPLYPGRSHKCCDYKGHSLNESTNGTSYSHGSCTVKRTFFIKRCSYCNYKESYHCDVHLACGASPECAPD